MCVGHKAKENINKIKEAMENIIRATFCSRFYPQAHIALQCLVHIRVTKFSPKCLIQAVSGLSHPPQVVWQALSHSSQSWKKAYPCATWQRAFFSELAPSSLVLPMWISWLYSQFDYLPGVWWTWFSIGCPPLIWCQLSVKPWMQGPYSDWWLWTLVLCGCRDS